MSQMTKEINAITGTIIGVSGKLIVYALVILLLVEGMTRGYAFGHEVFYATAMDPEPGIRYGVTIPEGQDAAETARMLKDVGLIRNEYALRIQMWFYDYEAYPGTYELSTAMTSKEILQILNVKPENEESEMTSQGTPETEAESDGEEISIQGEEDSGEEDSGISIEAEPEAEGDAL